jgi:putative chitinase
MHLDQDRLHELFPHAAAGHLLAIAEQAEEVLGRFGIDRNPARLNFFLAQIGHESAGLAALEERLSYSAVRLTQVWPTRFPTVASARPYARNPVLLANKVYAERVGNGPEGSGDGWNFRGRGYIQITGRDAYAAIGEATGLDLIAEPELAAAPDTALLVACGFWSWKGLNAICDTGSFDKVTRRINGGSHGMADRHAWLDRVRSVLAQRSADVDPRPALDVAA